jgi:hypothetical protein
MAGDLSSAAFDHLELVLTSGEEIVATAKQSLINSPLKQDVAVVTNRRLIFFRPKLLGRMDMDDFLWQDIDDLSIKTQLLGCTIQVRGSKRTKTGVEVSFQGKIEGLDKAQALKLYACAQEMEEQWREKNRARLLEEERARSGGVYLQSPVHPTGAAQPAAATIEERLTKLKSLLDAGLITGAEYDARKAQIVSEL